MSESLIIAPMWDEAIIHRASGPHASRMITSALQSSQSLIGCPVLSRALGHGQALSWPTGKDAGPQEHHLTNTVTTRKKQAWDPGLVTFLPAFFLLYLPIWLMGIK